MDKSKGQTAATGSTLSELTRQYAKLEQQAARQVREIEKLTAICKELLAENEALKAKLNPQTGSPDGYNNNWNWYRKITWILKTANRPLLSQEIIALLQQRDDNFRHNTNPVGFLSAYLTNAANRSLISRHKQPGTRGYFYCLPHWIRDGRLEQQYLTPLY
jgi:hypothetical protein